MLVQKEEKEKEKGNWDWVICCMQFEGKENEMLIWTDGLEHER